ncbi:hypothetical protein ARMA_2646 [Ardenticatena maritima]|uniref:DinB-like domain-containing protein n=1 Tax=Ardenticatena maritima TaxID=872965 RepID=A0A0M8K8X8_9CHLR|nr:DinB family protein [Ardenticatena maritima]KPL86939.1 hypothetical protein SE16_12755 [Ardenticatena maritima]GAP64223.1 hypothetical protein ARMA_2646 [Ardenticatena maritima]
MFLEKTRRKLEETRAETLALIEGCDEATLRAARVNDEWSAFDVLAHLAHSEADHLRTITATPEELAEFAATFDLDAWNRKQTEALRALSLPELLQRLADVRAQTMATLAEIGEEGMVEKVHHPVFGEIERGKLFRIIAMHERMHQQDIRKALQEAASA